LLALVILSRPKKNVTPVRFNIFGIVKKTWDSYHLFVTRAKKNDKSTMGGSRHLQNKTCQINLGFQSVFVICDRISATPLSTGKPVETTWRHGTVLRHRGAPELCSLVP